VEPVGPVQVADPLTEHSGQPPQLPGTELHAGTSQCHARRRVGGQRDVSPDPLDFIEFAVVRVLSKERVRCCSLLFAVC
jgi:hypothetical protein